MSTVPKNFVTVEEYLERERKAEHKNEYCNGEVFPTPGASRTHDRINSQLALLIGQHLSGTKYETFTANMRVFAAPGGLYTYPDLSVAFEPQFGDPFGETLTNPILLVEILSPGTEAYDRGQKARLYRAIPSLQELLLIAQDSYEVELFRRQPDSAWKLFEAGGLDGSIELASIGYTLLLREIYKKVLASNQAQSR